MVNFGNSNALQNCKAQQKSMVALLKIDAGVAKFKDFGVEVVILSIVLKLSLFLVIPKQADCFRC